MQLFAIFKTDMKMLNHVRLASWLAYLEDVTITPRQGHTKDHHKRSLTVQPTTKGQAVCVYGDIHYKDLLGSIARVGFVSLSYICKAFNTKKALSMDLS